MEEETTSNSQTGQKKYFAFDSETSGLRPHFDRIIELAAVELVLDDNAAETDRGMEPFSVLIDPERKLTELNMSIHGIKNEMLVNKPRFPEAWDLFSSYIASRCAENYRPVLVAHNADFDVRFLRKELQRSGQQFPDWDIACSITVVQKLFPKQSAKLRDLRTKFGVPNYTEHRAAGDVKVLCEVLNGINRIPAQKGPTVQELILEDAKPFRKYSRQGKTAKQAVPTGKSSRAAYPACDWCDDSSTPERSPEKQRL